MKPFLPLVVVMAAVVLGERPAESDCVERRHMAERLGAIMKLIPECEENGDYKQLQCYKDSKFCVCYNKKGHAVSPISTKIKECGCFLRSAEKRNSAIAKAYIPQCNEDGSFAIKQCWDYNNSCWCVDNEGNQQGDVVDDESMLNCE